MRDTPPTEPADPNPDTTGISTATSEMLPAGSAANTPPNTDESATQAPLTADEQMALYEKELKESDWGHQPC